MQAGLVTLNKLSMNKLSVHIDLCGFTIFILPTAIC